MGLIEGGMGPYLNAGSPVNGTNEVQTLTPSAAPASGQFRLQFEGFKTALLDFNVSAANMQAALNGLPSIGAGGAVVSLADGVYTVTFSGANMAIRAQPLITVVDSTLKDVGEAAVTLTPAESVAGVSATALGAGAGSVLIDTTNKVLYINMGTAAAPTWTKVLAGITLTAAVVNTLVAGAAGGYKIARGVHTTVDADDTVATGLATVVSVVATLESDPEAGCDRVTAAIGNQAGAPTAGSVYIKTWKPTAAGDTAPIAATAFTKKVNWIAVGT